MTDEKIIQELGFEKSPDNTKQEVVANVRSIINNRLMLLVDEMLTDSQREEFYTVSEASGEEKARHWLDINVVNTDELYESLLQDYINEKRS
jgi:hypothetical protein